MTYIIRLTPEQLRTKADIIEKNAPVVQKEISTIAKIIDGLRPTFLGETASIFFKEFNVAYEDIEKWQYLINSFTSELRDSADLLERADRS